MKIHIYNSLLFIDDRADLSSRRAEFIENGELPELTGRRQRNKKRDYDSADDEELPQVRNIWLIKVAK